jgi:Peptidase family M23
MRQLLALALGISLSFTSYQNATATIESNQEHANPSTVAVNWTPILISPVGPPKVFQGADHKYNLVYDIALNNFATHPSSIKQFDFLDGDNPQRVILSLKGPSLIQEFRHPGGKTTDMAPVTNGIIWANLSFDKLEQVPNKIIHRIVLETPFADEKQTTFDYKAAPVEVDRSPVIVLGPPLKGKWMAGGGYSTKSGHRTALFPISNHLIAAQTFAIDWMMVDSKNRTNTGGLAKSETYVGYGQPALAVADGTVVGVIDRFGDQKPNAPSGEDRYHYPSGNTVVIDLGNGNYAMYAHLKWGSIKVKEGERVKRGQEIALVGNSGNSSAPHLHLHIMTGPAVLDSPGVPYVFDSFEVVGAIDPDEDKWIKNDLAGAPQLIGHSPYEGKHTKELPRDCMIIDFE